MFPEPQVREPLWYSVMVSVYLLQKLNTLSMFGDYLGGFLGEMSLQSLARFQMSRLVLEVLVSRAHT